MVCMGPGHLACSFFEEYVNFEFIFQLVTRDFQGVADGVSGPHLIGIALPSKKDDELRPLDIHRHVDLN